MLPFKSSLFLDTSHGFVDSGLRLLFVGYPLLDQDLLVPKLGLHHDILLDDCIVDFEVHGIVLLVYNIGYVGASGFGVHITKLKQR